MTYTSPLNPHNLFWNDLLATSHTRNSTALTLKIDDLLHAPRVKASIFNVNKCYLGQPFINKDYA